MKLRISVCDAGLKARNNGVALKRARNPKLLGSATKICLHAAMLPVVIHQVSFALFRNQASSDGVVRE